jgi:hypothetical protein
VSSAGGRILMTDDVSILIGEKADEEEEEEEQATSSNNFTFLSLQLEVG